MDASLLWQRILRCSSKAQQENRTEQQRFVMEQWILARSVTFALEANQDIPPTKEEHQKAQKGQPNWGQIHENRRQRLRFIRQHHRALEHPYIFEEYMQLAMADGRGHVFEKPEGYEPDTLDTIAKKREEAKAREERMLAKLDALVAAGYGDTPFDSIPQATQQQ